MNSDSVYILYGMMGGIALLLVIFGITMFIVTKHKEKKKKYSLNSGGSDSSEISDILIEKFRNERINQKEEHMRKFTVDDPE